MRENAQHGRKPELVCINSSPIPLRIQLTLNTPSPFTSNTNPLRFATSVDYLRNNLSNLRWQYPERQNRGYILPYKCKSKLQLTPVYVIFLSFNF